MNRCLLLFFDNEYQTKLKEQVVSTDGFEYTLRNYRDVFLKDIVKLDNINLSCNCKECSTCFACNPISNKFESYMNDLCEDIKTKTELIHNLFDEIIDIYISALSISRSTAMKKLDDYLSNRCAGFITQDPFFFSTPFFRVRKTDKYDGSDIHELFHVPFNKRQSICNQRFSLTGVPLLYLSESIPLALKEIDCNNNRFNAAVFLPKYLNYRNESLYNMSNAFVDEILSIQDSIDSDKTLSYKCASKIINTKHNIDYFLAHFILSQCLHYSAHKTRYDSFIPEYLLPQLLMDVISEKNWIGIRYQSCKSGIYESRDRTMHCVDNNICFKVPYSPTKYNDEMLKDFYYATWSNDEKLRKYSELIHIMNDFIRLKDDMNRNGYVFPNYMSFTSDVMLHINKMNETIGKRAYQRRKACKVEITLLYKLFEQLMPTLMEPEKNGIPKRIGTRK